MGSAGHWKWFRNWFEIQRSGGQALTIGTNGVRVLPLAAGINKGGHYFRYIIGPSEVRAPAEQT